MEGYNTEFVTAMRMALQVLLSTVAPPDSKNVPQVGTVSLGRIMPIGSGFVYVPCAPDMVGADPRYTAQLRVPIKSASQEQFRESYPRWTEKDEAVSGAALYLWRNAVATATQPFSIEGSGSTLDDMASILAMSEPFAPMDKDSQAACKTLLGMVCGGPDAQFKDTKSLHLIQLTSTSVAPGNSNFSQPFKPLRVRFKGAGIVKTDPADFATPKYELEYSLGTEATVLIEAVFVITALLRVLELTNTPALADIDPDDAGIEVPLIHTSPCTFPVDIGDVEFKEEVLRDFDSSSTMPLGVTSAFTLPMFPGGQFNLEKYATFIQMDHPACFNKGGRVIFSGGRYKYPPGPTKAAPGYYRNTATAPGDDFRQMDKPGAIFRFRPVTDGSLKCQDTTVAITTGGLPDPDYQNQISDILSHRQTYADYFAAVIQMSFRSDRGEWRWRPNGNTAAGNGTAFHEDLSATPNKSIAFPVYTNDTDNDNFDLVGYIHIGGDIWITKRANGTYNLQPSRTWVNGIHLLMPNAMRRNGASGTISFEMDVVIGLRLGDDPNGSGTSYGDR
jgi:hypothetical protein